LNPDFLYKAVQKIGNPRVYSFLLHFKKDFDIIMDLEGGKVFLKLLNGNLGQ